MSVPFELNNAAPVDNCSFYSLGGGRSNHEAAAVEVEGVKTVVLAGGNTMKKPFHPQWMLMFQLMCK